jgi:hypothetical protein
VALATPALAEPELACDMQHQCYHMDPTHPDKVTPPPAPQYPSPKLIPHKVIPNDGTADHFGVPIPDSAPNPNDGTADHYGAEVPDYNPSPDCYNMRHGLFPTPEAAAAARAHCDGEAQWYQH